MLEEALKPTADASLNRYREAVSILLVLDGALKSRLSLRESSGAGGTILVVLDGALMAPWDHALTSSNGKMIGSNAYRDHLESLLADGNTRKAFATEILDVRRAALEGSDNIRKYNKAMKEMLEYARTLKQFAELSDIAK